MTTQHAKDCMDTIRELLAEPKPAGTWWATEILELKERGRPVTPLALEIAKRALGMQ